MHTFGAEYDLTLVGFSYLVGLLACFSGLLMAESVRHSVSRRRLVGWLGLGSLILGVGAWATHFLGMLAHRLPFPVSYDPLLILLSIVPMVAAAMYALYVISGQGRIWRDLLAGAVLGLGISALHYIGMAAMAMPAEVHYRPGFVALSLLVAMLCCMAAVRIRRLVGGGVFAKAFRRRLLLVAMLAALGMLTMHYVSMLGVEIVAQVDWLDQDGADHTKAGWVAAVLGSATALVVLASLLAVTFEHRLNYSQRLLNTSSERLLEVISAISDGVALFDQHGNIHLTNAALRRMSGVGPEWLRQVHLEELGFSGPGEQGISLALEALRRDGSWSGELWRASGLCRVTRVKMMPVRYSQGYEHHFVATFVDITEQRDREQQIHHLAFHDTLTGLPNRTHLAGQMQKLCDRRSGGVLMLLDISRFNELNDTLGYEKADLLLSRFAARLRRQGVPEAGLARVSGNEFAVLIDHVPQQEWIESLISEMSWPYDLDGYLHDCRFSVGMARLNDSICMVADWMSHASLALSHAKREGDRGVRWFEAEMEQAVHDRVLLEAELREVLAVGGAQLRLHFQPQVDRAGRMIGVEALVRWQHPERGLLSPGVFVSLAEETGQIQALGSWVLREGCRQLAAWRATPEMAQIRLSINVSVRQFQRPDFAREVMTILEQTGAPPAQLTLELTESLMMEQRETTVRTMQVLRSKGIRFSLDDFGTGYSSLGYLNRFPFDLLKIDGAFVRSAVDNAGSAAIIRTIIALANSLGLVVIAEGVETVAQRDFLLSCGCRCYQGYLFGRPVPAGELWPQPQRLPA